MDDPIDIVEMEQQIAKFDIQDKITISEHEKQVIITKAYKDSLYTFYKTLFQRQMVQDFMNEEKVPVVPTDLNMRQYVEKAISNQSIKPPYILITVNAYPDLDFEQLKKKVEKFVNRRFVSAFIYAYEVRKEDLTGLHCHMLIHYNCKPHDVKRNAKSTFKDCCNVKDDRILNFKFVNPDNLQSKIEYVKGVKKDAKMKAMDYTHKFQAEHILQPYYESTPQLPCRGAEEIANAD